MVNKLTSIKGFGEGNPKGEKSDAKNKAIHAKTGNHPGRVKYGKKPCSYHGNLNCSRC